MPNVPDVVISPELEHSLQLSISQYQAILQLMQLIADSLKSTPDRCASLVHQLQEQQLAAQQHDEQLLELLRVADVTCAQHSLCGQRLDLIEQILQLNHLLLPNINGIMALYFNELTELRSGRVGLSGYKQAPARRGRIVKSSV
jgi:hypothetical protein